MKPTIDMRRRQSPLTLDRILYLQLRAQRRTGERDMPLLLRTDQQREFYELLRWQVMPLGTRLRVESEIAWNSLEVVAR